MSLFKNFFKRPKTLQEQLNQKINGQTVKDFIDEEVHLRTMKYITEYFEQEDLKEKAFKKAIESLGRVGFTEHWFLDEEDLKKFLETYLEKSKD